MLSSPQVIVYRSTIHNVKHLEQKNKSLHVKSVSKLRPPGSLVHVSLATPLTCNGFIGWFQAASLFPGTPPPGRDHVQ